MWRYSKPPVRTYSIVTSLHLPPRGSNSGDNHVRHIHGYPVQVCTRLVTPFANERPRMVAFRVSAEATFLAGLHTAAVRTAAIADEGIRGSFLWYGCGCIGCIARIRLDISAESAAWTEISPHGHTILRRMWSLLWLADCRTDAQLQVCVIEDSLGLLIPCPHWFPCPWPPKCMD